MRKTQKPLSTVLLIFATVVSVFSTCYGQNGNVDVSFGTAGNGLVVTNLGTGSILGRDIIQQKSGKLIVGGAGASKMMMIRYHTNGTQDFSFGSGGVAYSPTSLNNLAGTCIGQQDDGKLIIAGTNGTGNSASFVICRFDSSGIIDPTFGFGGMATVDFAILPNTGDIPWSMYLGKGGLMYIVGQTSNGTDLDLAVAKLRNGSFVNSFGVAGKTTFDFGNGNDIAKGIGVLSNGNLVIGGSSYNGSDYDFATVCIDTNGVVVTSFGTNGMTRYNQLNYNDTSEDLIISENDKIFMVGGSGLDFTVACIGGNGLIDSSFGTNGWVRTNISGDDYGMDIALQKDGKIVVGGEAGNGGNYRFATVRYTSAGTLDTSYSVDGISVATAPINGVSYSGQGLVIQSDGKIALGGYKSLTNVYEFSLTRFNNAYAYFNLYPDTIPQHWIATNEAAGTPPMTYLWSWGDGNTSTGATPSHTYSSPGFYNICLTITDANNCVSTYCDSSTYIFHATSGNSVIYISVVQGPLAVGLNETFTGKRVSIFPNPTSSMLTIRNVSSPAVEIFNLLGQEVEGVEMIYLQNKEMSLDVSKLKSGIYLLRIDEQMVRFVRQ
jgi:uncharacterized delta-60 repeat protein